MFSQMQFDLIHPIIAGVHAPYDIPTKSITSLGWQWMKWGGTFIPKPLRSG
jgi:hypothetical protein